MHARRHYGLRCPRDTPWQARGTPFSQMTSSRPAVVSCIHWEKVRHGFVNNQVGDMLVNLTVALSPVNPTMLYSKAHQRFQVLKAILSDLSAPPADIYTQDLKHVHARVLLFTCPPPKPRHPRPALPIHKNIARETTSKLAVVKDPIRRGLAIVQEIEFSQEFFDPKVEQSELSTTLRNAFAKIRDQTPGYDLKVESRGKWA